MAARENQGLHIALIVFVVLTILLAVTTFMFFSRWDEELAKIADFEKATKTANTQADEYLTELKEVKTILGVTAADNLKTIGEMKKSDFEQWAPGTPDDKQNYHDLAKQLYTTLAQKQKDIIAAQEREQKLADKIKSDEATKVVEVNTYKKTVDERSADYTTERNKLNEQVSSAATAKSEAQQNYDARRKEFDSEVARSKAEVNDLNDQIVKLKQTISRMVDEREKEEKTYEVADGRVRWVNQGEQLVWIDRGSADGLNQQVAFNVIDRDEPNAAAATPKGTIEVIRVTDRHSAEARIISDNPTNPILPGDLLFHAAWQPGRIEHFALADFMDIDGDGLSDRETIKQIIIVSGGVIDAEVTDEGKWVGDMEVGTKYLILGDRPTDKNLNPDVQKNRNRILDAAKRLGVKQLSVDKFLDYVGYEVRQKTVALDRNARRQTLKPDFPKSLARALVKRLTLRRPARRRKLRRTNILPVVRRSDDLIASKTAAGSGHQIRRLSTAISLHSRAVPLCTDPTHLSHELLISHNSALDLPLRHSDPTWCVLVLLLVPLVTYTLAAFARRYSTGCLHASTADSFCCALMTPMLSGMLSLLWRQSSTASAGWESIGTKDQRWMARMPRTTSLSDWITIRLQ